MIEKVGRYRLVARIGRGSMGTVYRAEDTLIQRSVALKLVSSPGPGATPFEHESYARFLREARAAGRLCHPNVVTIFDTGEDLDQGISFIAMELVDGASLATLLQAGARFDFDAVRAIGIQTAAALEAAHRAGVVHRDIKPGNLLLSRSGALKVTDFGIAKIVDACVTQDGTVLGSPSYMSPEQLRASGVDERSDLFSLGAVLYELATGRRAFPGKTLAEVVGNVLRNSLVAPHVWRPDIPSDLERVILRSLDAQRDERFLSAAEVMAALLGDTQAIPPVERRALDRALAGTAAQLMSGAETAEMPTSAPAPAVATPTSLAAPAAPAIAAATVLAAPAAPAVGAATLLATPPAPAVAAATLLATPPAADPHRARERAARGRRRWLRAGAAAAALAGIAAMALLTVRGASREADVAPAGPVPLVGPPASLAPVASCADAVLAPAPALAAPALAAPAPARVDPAASLLPFRIEVQHQHLVDACEGTLTIASGQLLFRSTRPGEDRKWRLADLRSGVIAADRLELIANERDGKTLGLRARRYRFRTVGGELPVAVRRYLAARLARP